MVRIYSHPDPGITQLVHNALSQRGIAAVVRGTAYGAASGELPPVAAWSEVWVADADRRAEAEATVAEVTADAPASEPWTCPACGETSEGHFGACWGCGADRPD